MLLIMVPMTTADSTDGTGKCTVAITMALMDKLCLHLPPPLLIVITELTGTTPVHILVVATESTQMTGIFTARDLVPRPLGTNTKEVAIDSDLRRTI